MSTEQNRSTRANTDMQLKALEKASIWYYVTYLYDKKANFIYLIAF